MGPKLISVSSQIWNQMDPESKKKYEDEAKISR